MNKKTTPLVSVIIPVYNRAYCIHKTLKSVFNQTYKNYEIIVVDDGSTDSLKETLAPYLDKIVFLSQGNRGPSAARNLGLSHAKGEYISPLDSDDVWKSDYLENAINKIIRHKYQIYISFWDEVTRSGSLKKVKHLPHSDILQSKVLFTDYLFRINLGANSGMVFDKTLLSNGWNTSIKIGDDWVLLIDLLLNHKYLRVGFDEETKWIKFRNKDNICDGTENEQFRLDHLNDIKTIIQLYKNLLTPKQLELLNIKLLQNILILCTYNLKYLTLLQSHFKTEKHLKLLTKSIFDGFKRYRRIYEYISS